jgi:hypothetical protein
MLDRSASYIASCRLPIGTSAILTLKTPNDLVSTSMLRPIQEDA